MIDTHCHLFNEYYENIDKVIEKMKENIIIVSGTNLKNNKELISLCKKYDNVYGTIGLHPTELENISIEDFEFIEKNINNPKIVGIGEIGLDYHYNNYDKKLQKEIFIKQIYIAKKYNKTIVIHSRDAINDTYEILKEHAQELKKIMHCFSSSVDMAKKFIKLNCKLGIGGTLTFKNNEKTKEVVKQISLDNLLLETDSPFLTPEPFRGKKNEPYNVLYVAKKIAEIKEINIDDVIKTTTNNAIVQFDLPNIFMIKWIYHNSTRWKDEFLFTTISW